MHLLFCEEKDWMTSSTTLSNSQKTIPISLQSIDEIANFLLHQNNLQGAMLGIHFVGKKKISQLHEQFFNDPSPTDCITFPCDSPDSPPCECLGEIFICPLIGKEYTEKNGGDLYEEITLYLVHGFLHLLGYNDILPHQQEEMRRQEKKWMQVLAKNNQIVKPY